VVVVSGSGDEVVVVVESCSALDTSHPWPTRDTHDAGMGFTGVRKCQPVPVPVPTHDLNPWHSLLII